MMLLTKWPNKFTAKLLAPNKPNLISSVFLLCTALILASCATKSAPSTPPAASQQGGSLESLTQGLAYIREHPATREEEQVQRYLWLDTWMKTLQERGRLTPEMSQEYWNDFDSFLKQPPATTGALEKIVGKAQSRIGRNVALYAAYQEFLRNQKLEDSLKFLEKVEEDGTTGLFARSQDILQLNSFTPSEGSRKLGVLLPLSGELKGFAQEALLGVQIASRMAIAEGVEFTIEDSGSNQESLSNAMQKLAVTENVTAILGPLTAKETEAAFERAEVLRVPVISLAAREDLKTFGTYGFRSLLSIDDQVAALANFMAKELHSKKIGVLSPDSSYGWDVLDRASKAFKDHGLEVVDMRIYAQGSTDFKEPLRQMTMLDVPKLRKDEVCPKAGATPAAPVAPVEGGVEPPAVGPASLGCVKKLGDLRPIVGFDTLFLPDFAETVGLMLPTLPYLRIYGVQVVGLSGLNSKRLIERAGASAEGVIFTDSYNAESERYPNRFFNDEFKKVAGRDPSRVAAEAFDLALIAISLMTKDNKAVSRDIFADRLRNIDKFEGVTGSISYQDQRLKKSPEFFVVREQNFTAMK